MESYRKSGRRGGRSGSERKCQKVKGSQGVLWGRSESVRKFEEVRVSQEGSGGEGQNVWESVRKRQKVGEGYGGVRKGENA